MPGRCELVLYRRRVRPLLPRLFAALATFASGLYAGGLWQQLHECNALLGPLCCGVAPQ